MSRNITFCQATKEAMAEEMRADPDVFVYGEDIVNRAVFSANLQVCMTNSVTVYLIRQLVKPL